MTGKMEKTLVGPAGESLVLSRLLSRGYLASAAPRGVRKVDIIVNHLQEEVSKMVQVKTTMKSPVSGWPLDVGHETILDDDLIYCFVSFQDPMGKVYVIPARTVGDAIRIDHEVWLGQLGRDGKPHSPANEFRQIKAVMNGKDTGWLDEYLENWGLIGARQES
jgi:primosomal replication protein N